MPTLKSKAVKMAPIQTSRHLTRASGSTLKIIAKSRVMTRKETIKFSACATRPGIGRALPSAPVKAESNAEITMEMRSKKPTPRTMAKERKRLLIKPQIPRPGLGCTSQITFSES